MTFKPKLWYPIASILAVGNVVAVWFAAAPGEAFHATAHGALAAAFAFWAARLKARLPSASDPGALGVGTDTLALDVDDLRQQLAETQERLDFAERVLVQQKTIGQDR